MDASGGERRIPRWCGAAAAVAVGLVLLDWTLQPVLGRDTDLWWHLAVGRQIWDTGRVATVDTFSHTAAGRPFIDIAWAFQAMLYALYRAAGMDGPIVLRSLLELAGLACLARTARLRGAGWGATAAAILGAGWIATRYAFIRPDLATLVCAAAFLLLLETHRRSGSRRTLWALPPFTAIWFNLHGGGVMAPALVGIYALADHLERRTETAARHWLFVMLGCVAALFVTPQPWIQFHYATTILQANPFRRYISEWGPLNWAAPETHVSLAYLGLCAVSAILALRRGNRIDLLLVLPFGAMVLSAWRHQFLFLPLLAPTLAGGLSAIRCRAPRNALLAIGLLAVAVAAWTAADVVRRASPPDRLIRRETLPEAACDFLLANHIHGRLWNDMSWGGYLMWRLGSDCPVYFDGRNELVYPTHLLSEYWDAIGGAPDALQRLDARRIDIVAGNSLLARWPLFARVLPNSPAWVRAYDDGSAFLYVRRRVLPARTRMPDDFMTRYRRGLDALSRAHDRAAAADFSEALREYPDFAAAHLQRGVAEVALGEREAAARDWREALRINPEQGDAHKNLGLLALMEGHPREAACEFAAELDRHPDNEVARQQAAPLPPPGWLRCVAHAVGGFLWPGG